MRRLFPLIMFASLLLSTCQASSPQETAEPSATTEASTAIPQATATTGKTATDTPQSQATTSSMELAAASPGCTVQSPFPTPGPTEQALLPPTSSNDWVTGGDTAQITFTEYSDFQ